MRRPDLSTLETFMANRYRKRLLETGVARPAMVARYLGSRMNQRAFAAKVGMGYSRLTQWLRESRKAEGMAEPGAVPAP